MAELVALAPDVILTTGPFQHRPAVAGNAEASPSYLSACLTRSAAALSQVSRVPAATRPGLRILNFGMSAKWPELLKQIAPKSDARCGASRSQQSRRHRTVAAIQAVALHYGWRPARSTYAARTRSNAGSREFARASESRRDRAVAGLGERFIAS